jgi:hypothetical protein
MPRETETSWRQLAVGAREAIRLLNYPVVMEECLPGEPGGPGCGGDEWMHFLGYLMVIRATAEHYLSHAAGDPELDAALKVIYEEAAEITAGSCGAG